MIAAQVMGNHQAVSIGGQHGPLQLNMMMPLIARNLLESIRLLTNGVNVFTERCVAGIEADVERCGQMIEQSLAMCTSLAPAIGYDQAAAIAKEAFASGQTVREVALARNVLPADELNKLLDPGSMTEPSSS